MPPNERAPAVLSFAREASLLASRRHWLRPAREDALRACKRRRVWLRSVRETAGPPTHLVLTIHHTAHPIPLRFAGKHVNLHFHLDPYDDLLGPETSSASRRFRLAGSYLCNVLPRYETED